MDFPRLQIAVAAGVILAAALFLLSGPGPRARRHGDGRRRRLPPVADLPLHPLRAGGGAAGGSGPERHQDPVVERPDGEPAPRSRPRDDRGVRSRHPAADGDRPRLDRRARAGASALSHRAARAAGQPLRHGLRDAARRPGCAHRPPDQQRHAVGLRGARRPRGDGLPLRRAASAPAGPRREHEGARRPDPLRGALCGEVRDPARRHGRLQRRGVVGHVAAVQACRRVRRSPDRPGLLRELRCRQRLAPLPDRPVLRDAGRRGRLDRAARPMSGRIISRWRR